MSMWGRRFRLPNRGSVAATAMLVNSVIKTIFFDLGNVIIPFDFKRAYTKLQPLCNYAVTEIPQRMRGTDLVSRFECGQIGPEEFVKEFSAVLELRISYEI